MLQPIQDYLKSADFKIVDTTINSLIAFQHKNKIIISIVDNKKCVIAKEVDSDIRFKGEIANVQQLKMILGCVLKYGI